MTKPDDDFQWDDLLDEAPQREGEPSFTQTAVRPRSPALEAAVSREGDIAARDEGIRTRTMPAAYLDEAKQLSSTLRPEEEPPPGTRGAPSAGHGMHSPAPSQRPTLPQFGGGASSALRGATPLWTEAQVAAALALDREAATREAAATTTSARSEMLIPPPMTTAYEPEPSQPHQQRFEQLRFIVAVSLLWLWHRPRVRLIVAGLTLTFLTLLIMIVVTAIDWWYSPF